MTQNNKLYTEICDIMSEESMNLIRASLKEEFYKLGVNFELMNEDAVIYKCLLRMMKTISSFSKERSLTSDEEKNITRKLNKLIATAGMLRIFEILRTNSLEGDASSWDFSNG